LAPFTVLYWKHFFDSVMMPVPKSAPADTAPSAWTDVEHVIEHADQVPDSHSVVVHGGLAGHGVTLTLRQSPVVEPEQKQQSTATSA
jgi:hypothetical protein